MSSEVHTIMLGVEHHPITFVLCNTLFVCLDVSFDFVVKCHASEVTGHADLQPYARVAIIEVDLNELRAFHQSQVPLILAGSGADCIIGAQKAQFSGCDGSSGDVGSVWRKPLKGGRAPTINFEEEVLLGRPYLI